MDWIGLRPSWGPVEQFHFAPGLPMYATPLKLFAPWTIPHDKKFSGRSAYCSALPFHIDSAHYHACAIN